MLVWNFHTLLDRSFLLVRRNDSRRRYDLTAPLSLKGCQLEVHEEIAFQNRQGETARSIGDRHVDIVTIRQLWNLHRVDRAVGRITQVRDCRINHRVSTCARCRDELTTIAGAVLVDPGYAQTNTEIAAEIVIDHDDA